jgi:hypothetical protein
MKSRKRFFGRWYVLSNEVGTILGVYGEALRDMAEDRAKKLRQEFPFARVDLNLVETARPSVGQNLSVIRKRSPLAKKR